MQLEKDIPVPELKRYKFEDWQVGDSKYFDSLAEVESCYSAAYSYEKTHQIGLRMSRRKEGNGFRLWRVQ